MRGSVVMYCISYLIFSHDVVRLNHLKQASDKRNRRIRGCKIDWRCSCKSHHVTLTICCGIIFLGIACYALYRSNNFKFLVLLFGSFPWEHRLTILITTSQSRRCNFHILFLLRQSPPFSTKPWIIKSVIIVKEFTYEVISKHKYVVSKTGSYSVPHFVFGRSRYLLVSCWYPFTKAKEYIIIVTIPPAWSWRDRF
jgi:hypothetical protein